MMIRSHVFTLALFLLTMVHGATSFAATGDIQQRLEQASEAAARNESRTALDTWRQIGASEEATSDQRYEAWLAAARLLATLDQPLEAAEAYLAAARVPEVRHTVASDRLVNAGDLFRQLRLYDRAIEAFTEARDLPAGWKRHALAEGLIWEIEALRDGDRGFWIDPYVPNVSPTEATVLWVSRPGVDPGELTLLIDGRPARRITSEVTPVWNDEGLYHQVQLDGLTPHTRYQYLVTCDGAQREGSLITTAPSDKQPPIRFLVYGDSQDRPRDHTDTAAMMAKEHADFVLHTGDMVGSGDRWGHWKVQYFDPARPLLQHAAIWPAIGNHDGRRFFDNLFLRKDQLYTRFRSGNAEFFLLASYRSGSQSSAVRQAQAAWLDEALATSDAKWTFVVLHHPMLYPGRQFPQQPADQSGWGQRDFLPIVQKHAVDFVFSGHYHVYQRLMPVADPDRKPVFHITTGGAASITTLGEPSLPSPILDVGIFLLHYCLIEIDGDRLTMHVKRNPGGDLIDSLELVKRDGRFQPEIESRAVSTAQAIRTVSPYHQQRWEAEEAATGGVPVRMVPHAGPAVPVYDKAFVQRVESLHVCRTGVCCGPRE